MGRRIRGEDCSLVREAKRNDGESPSKYIFRVRAGRVFDDLANARTLLCRIKIYVKTLRVLKGILGSLLGDTISQTNETVGKICTEKTYPPARDEIYRKCTREKKAPPAIKLSSWIMWLTRISTEDISK